MDTIGLPYGGVSHVRHTFMKNRIFCTANTRSSATRAGRIVQVCRAVLQHAHRANCFGLTESCQVPISKIIRFTGIPICGINHPVSCPLRDVSRSSRYVGHGMRWTLRRQVIFTGRNVRSVRRSRVVLAPRPWRQVGAKYRADDGGKKRRSPGRARISRNTIARGKPGCPGCTCSLTRVLFCSTLAHGTAGAVGARLSLRPLSERGTTNWQHSGEIEPRERSWLSLNGLFAQ
jgi:hypothetical protein